MFNRLPLARYISQQNLSSESNFQNLRKQVMTTNLWIEQFWYDYKLKWNPEEYGGEYLHLNGMVLDKTIDQGLRFKKQEFKSFFPKPRCLFLNANKIYPIPQNCSKMEKISYQIDWLQCHKICENKMVFRLSLKNSRFQLRNLVYFVILVFY